MLNLQKYLIPMTIIVGASAILGTGIGAAISLLAGTPTTFFIGAAIGFVIGSCTGFLVGVCLCLVLESIDMLCGAENHSNALLSN